MRMFQSLVDDIVYSFNLFQQLFLQMGAKEYVTVQESGKTFSE
jgi:hypothetical protein